MKNKGLNLVLLLGVFIFFLPSCSKNISNLQTTTDDETIVYPAPPDTARIQYLTSISSSADIVKKRGGLSKFVMGDKQYKPIGKPYGVDMHKGKIYICDSEIGGLEIIDMEKETFDYFVPSGLGQLKLPLNCNINDNGFIYVADVGRNQVVVFNEDGQYVNAFGDKGVFKPVDVFVHKNIVWVADIKGAKIYAYSNDSVNKFLFTLSVDSADHDKKLFAPTNIYVTDDYVYVSDNGDYKIKKYTHEGKYVSFVGGHGTGIGQFARPKGIAVDRDANLFAIDGLFENVQIFNNDNQLLMFFAGHYDAPGGLWLPATIAINYDDIEYFQKYVNSNYKLKYLILVTNQFGLDKLNIYGAVDPID